MLMCCFHMKGVRKELSIDIMIFLFLAARLSDVKSNGLIYVQAVRISSWKNNRIFFLIFNSAVSAQACFFYIYFHSLLSKYLFFPQMSQIINVFLFSRDLGPLYYFNLSLQCQPYLRSYHSGCWFSRSGIRSSDFSALEAD